MGLDPLENVQMAQTSTGKVNYFCRRNFVEGWVNIDPRIPIPSGRLSMADGRFLALKHNARAPLPFLDNSQESFYIGIDFQQLPLNVAETFLCNVYRVLVPGGRLRLFTHDLINIFKGMVEDRKDLWPTIELARNKVKHPATSQECREMLETSLRYEKVHTIWFNTFFFGLGYNFIYDFDSLSALCENAGFSREKIKRCEFQESELPDIVLLEPEPLPYRERALYLEMEK